MDKGVTTEAFLFGAFRLDRRAGALFRRDERGAAVPVTIGSRWFAVQDMLVARHGELVSKNEIMRAVWSGTVFEDNNLTVQITALRRSTKVEREVVASRRSPAAAIALSRR